MTSYPAFRRTALAVLLAALHFSTAAADWPQYRGPNHDGTTSEKILQAWPAAGLREVWKVPLTDGFSSFTVNQGRAFSLVQRAVEGVNREVCVALDAATGKELWAATLGNAKYAGGGNEGAKDNNGGDGPRSTPTADGKFVYVLDARLNLTCLEAATGKTAWSKELLKETGGKLAYWENAASPVIDGDLIFVCAGAEGQSLLGVSKRDGHLVWKGENDGMTHATPVVGTILGVRQVIFFTQTGLVAAEAKSGKVLWRYPFRFNVSTAASPIIGGDIVYCAAGYGVGSGAVKITKDGDGFKATEIWRLTGNKIANHWSTPVLKDGHLYGMFSFKEYGTGALKCVELATGKEVWAQPGFGPGNVILVNGQLLVLNDRGQISLVEASPAGYKEIARSAAVTGKCWSTPSYSHGHIFARSTKEGVCLDATPKSAGR